MAISAENFAKMIRGLNPKLKDFEKRPELEDLAEVVRTKVVENFADETDRHHNAWLPRVGNPKHLPLRKTFNMFNAATKKGSTGNVEIIRSDELIVGVNSEIPYAKYQQFGNGRVPAREYLYVHKADLPDLDKPVEDFQNRFVEAQIKEHQDLR